MLYSGIDLHKHSLAIHTVAEDGTMVREAEFATTRPALTAYFATTEPGPHRAVVECLGSWYWVRDLVVPQGIDLRLGHAKYLKAISYTKVKRGVWSVVHVPSLEDEDRRQMHRELFVLTGERTRQVNRIKGLLALHGVAPLAARGLPRVLPELRAWDHEPLPRAAQARLEREWVRLTVVRREMRQLLAERRLLLHTAVADEPVVRLVRQLLVLRGIGEVSAWLYAAEFFAWRRFRNRREVGALAGLCSTRRCSGDLEQEHGISKAGNPHIRALAIELAWSWLRRQPQSALSQWYRRRFALGGSRMRRIGIVALARKLLIVLWRYLETGVVPEGSLLKA